MQLEKEGDIAGPNASSSAPFLILHHIAVHLGQEYFLRDIYVYSTRIQNKFLCPIFQLDPNTVKTNESRARLYMLISERMLSAPNLVQIVKYV